MRIFVTKRAFIAFKHFNTEKLRSVSSLHLNFTQKISDICDPGMDKNTTAHYLLSHLKDF